MIPWPEIVSLVLGGLFGAFGTAFVCERTGRDVSLGGMIGLAAGALLGPHYMVMAWVWLFVDRRTFVVRSVNGLRRRWWDWWRP